MGSVEWEDESWWKREWGSPKEVYKLHTEGKSIAGIARELNFSPTKIRTLLIRGKVRQFYALRSLGVPFEEALNAVRLPNPKISELRLSFGKRLKWLEERDLEYANRIDKMQHPFYGMTLLVNYRQAIEALLEDMNERAKNKP